MEKMNQNDRTQFLAVLQALVRAAKKNNNVITQQQLDKALQDFSLDAAQKQMVEDYLSSNNIGIDVPPDMDEVLTKEEHDYLKEYEEMVRSLPHPSGGELEALKIASMAGEKDAQAALTEYMLPKVIDIARLYAGQGVYLEDLVGAGNEALVRSVTLLAPLEGPEEVEGTIGKYIMDAMEDMIAANLDEKATDNAAVSRANRILEAADALADEIGRKVTVEELSSLKDIPEEDIYEAIRITGDNIENLVRKSEI